MERVFAEQVIDNIALLAGEDALHMSRVMRKQVGDPMEVVFEGKLFGGEICEVGKKSLQVRLGEQLPVTSEPKIKVTLFQGIAKGAHMDYAIQKAAEIGAYAVVPVRMERSVKKGDSAQRWNRISYEACKQCKRVHVPPVGQAVGVQEIPVADFDLFLMPYELEEERDLRQALQQRSGLASVGILIGPEGGISPEEVETMTERGACSVTLGRRILRTETAGLVCTAAVLYEMGELS